MDVTQLMTAIEREGAAFRRSAVTAGFDAPVVSCPGWNVADLVWHVAEVHYFWATVVEQKVAGWKDVERIERCPDDQLLDAFDAQLGRLMTVLSTVDPSTEVWTW